MSARTPEREASISTEDGVTLEARGLLPDAPRGLAVLCHPHPIGDGGANRGTMDNKVIHGMMRVLRDRGVASVRFNFRSAGASSGVHDGGDAERHDVRAALAWLRQELDVTEDPNVAGTWPNLVHGYSFGSWVGLKVAAEDPHVTHRVAVGPPVSVPGYDWEFLAQDPRPLTFVVGDRDEYCALPDLDRLRLSLGYPTQLRVVPEAGHFFLGQGHLLRRQLEEIAEEIWPAG